MEGGQDWPSGTGSPRLCAPAPFAARQAYRSPRRHPGRRVHEHKHAHMPMRCLRTCAHKHLNMCVHKSLPTHGRAYYVYPCRRAKTLTLLHAIHASTHPCILASKYHWINASTHPCGYPHTYTTSRRMTCLIRNTTPARIVPCHRFRSGKRVLTGLLHDLLIVPRSLTSPSRNSGACSKQD